MYTTPLLSNVLINSHVANQKPMQPIVVAAPTTTISTVIS